MVSYLFHNKFFRWPQKCPGKSGRIRDDLESGSVNKDYGSQDPDPKEIFTDPQHCRIAIENLFGASKYRPLDM
jgi:hypothetical protein